jgi:hypothetical protein
MIQAHRDMYQAPAISMITFHNNHWLIKASTAPKIMLSVLRAEMVEFIQTSSSYIVNSIQIRVDIKCPKIRASAVPRIILSVLRTEMVEFIQTSSTYIVNSVRIRVDIRTLEILDHLTRQEEVSMLGIQHTLIKQEGRLPIDSLIHLVEVTLIFHCLNMSRLEVKVQDIQMTI